MIEKLAQLLRSEDLETFKLGIELLLTLEEEEQIYEGFGDCFVDGDCAMLVPGKQCADFFRKSKMEGLKQPSYWEVEGCWDMELDDLEYTRWKRKNEAMAQAGFFALLQAVNKFAKLTTSYHICNNHHFVALDLLTRTFWGIDTLILDGFDWPTIAAIVTCNPHLKHVDIRGRTVVPWDEAAVIFAKLDSLSIQWLPLPSFPALVSNQSLLSPLQKGTKHEVIHSIVDVERMLSEADLGMEAVSDSWLKLLRRLHIDLLNKVKNVAFRMVFCPAGCFWMGIDSRIYWNDDSKPAHKVHLSRCFWMAETEVTQALWQAVMGNNPSQYVGPDMPVHNVCWYESVQFCNALSELHELEPAYIIDDSELVEWNQHANGYRLPFEHEWEYAAKREDRVDYVDPEVDQKIKQPFPVHQGTANHWGLRNMIGHMEQMCNDEYRTDRYENRESEKVTDPYHFPDKYESRRVNRGGQSKSYFTFVERDESMDDASYNLLGFRLVRPAIL